MDRKELTAKAREFKAEAEKAVKEALEKHKEFLRLYPYREHPEEIDLLTPEKITLPSGRSL